jgi:hypothetical protein
VSISLKITSTPLTSYWAQQRMFRHVAQGVIGK